MNHSLTRRSFLGVSLATATTAALAACSGPPPSSGSVVRILPTDPLVATFEAKRAASGRTISQQLTAGMVGATLAGTAVSTWGYNDALNGPLIRAQVGDLLDVPLTNGLAEATSVHWHGLALRNDADGVPGVTQKPVLAGADYSYQFRLNRPGTYWYHSHVDTQRERALYGALVVDDPKEPLAYDQEWVIVLDDWLDGITGTPEDVLSELSMGMGMAGMDMSSGMKYALTGSNSDYLGGDAGDVKIPVHLFNGKAAQEAEVIQASPGSRVRLRIINAAGDTAYRVGVPGQKITLTHSDGFPVRQQEVDAVVLGMGERIDALLTVKEGYTPVLALAEGKEGGAHGVISTSGVGSAPAAADLPTVLAGTVMDGGRLKADDSVLLDKKSPDRTHTMRLTGSMEKYEWGINGRSFDPDKPFEGAFDISLKDRVRVKFVNETTMWHPMHVHGHTFQVSGGGARKDTVIVRPKETVTVEFDADNPGQWIAHCHNAYHAARGMMGLFSYVR
ncbi:multicopper oxidase family protein [Cryobacterium sp. PH31-AA6]|uniref:multicopper oxidase family protein n=1 Tax=Cryobacterium sp. PH31-AA6 TaxID=3046205 RepID=UPI0024BBDACA|nr:multicopper oxidase family protein [Cryobacterium sp. PH31-AA6]MDJ0323951.1 multicopper oxidase family protein [Cryobacterium sp. PH31-AA6]